MSGHAYHPHCGCGACCRIEEAQEREDDVLPPPADVLNLLAETRRHPRLPYYDRAKSRAMRPTLAGLAAAERAITRCGAQS